MPAGFNYTGDDGLGPTAGRVTTVTLDPPDRVLIERGLNETRRGGEVAKADAEGVNPSTATFGMRYWSSGCWTLRPSQADITTIHEESAGQSAALGLSDFSLYQLNVGGTPQQIIKAAPKWAKSSLTNPGYTAAIATSGDVFLHPQWPAGADLNSGAVAANASLVSTVPQVTLPNLTTPMVRAGVSTATFPQDQGLFFRFSGAGTYHHAPRYVTTLYFGQYAVTFTGDGRALLNEYCQPATGGAARWVFRKDWRYADAKQVMNTAHTILIWPHCDGNNNKYIAFANNDLEGAHKADTGQKAVVGFSAPKEVIYHPTQTSRGGDIDAAGVGHVTTAGPVAWDIRNELHVETQISKLIWATSGKLVDFAHSLGTAVSNTNPLTLTMANVIPAGTTLTNEVHAADNAGAVFRPGTDRQPYPVFFLGGDGTKTPILYGYHLHQSEVVTTATPGSFTVDTEQISVNDFCGDPAQVSASAEVYDLANAHTRLQKRGRLRVNVAVTDPTCATSGNPTGRVSVFDGYVVRPRSVTVGPDVPPGFGAVTRPHRTYPAPGWRRYHLAMMGMWMRLAERVTPSFGVFALDPAATPDAATGYLPWKVTDAIRFLLLSCGFDSAQVDIPDLSYRMWPGHAGTVTDGIIEPGADVAEAIVRMCRNYLGCYLWWNPNSGATGKWQLLFATQPNSDGTFTPVYNFVTTACPVAGGLTQWPGNYGALTTFIDGAPEYVTIPPDFNTVVVSCGAPLTGGSARLRSVAYAYNYASYNVPGSSITADPEGADYIGYALPVEIIDPSLQGVTDADTWKAVSWTCRRAYDFYCHAQRIVTFTAPLALILDAGLGVYRPLRFQDPVSLDGQNKYLVKSVTMNWSKSSVMMARYEIIAPFPGQYFYGTDGLHFERDAGRRSAHKATGHKTRSNHWGLQSVGQAHEQAEMALPLNNVYQVPLQDGSGNFVPIAGYNTATGGSG